MKLYSLLFANVVRHLDAERAHAWAMRALRLVAHRWTLGRPIGALLRTRDPRLAVDAFGRTFPSPLGVAAGMDKTAKTYNQLAKLGFGFVEVGTATFTPQPGAPRPRVWRLLHARAVLNSMGFPNPGAAAIAARLRKSRRETIVGVNIGKSRNVAVEQANRDYTQSAALVGPLADFVVLNVSSPNTPGLRDLQDVERLATLLGDVRGALKDAGASIPLLLKIAPDLSDEQVDALADFSVSHGLDGLIAVNTTVARDGLEGDPIASSRPGGISGAPLKARAVEVLERLYDRVGDDVTLISVGGVETVDDAWQRIAAGATLVQTYTGFVFGGPLWPRHINRGLLARLEEHGMSSLAEVRGSAGSPAVAGLA